MLKSIHIKNLWGGESVINWENIDPKVNILVGINGSGKSTLLNLIEEEALHKNTLAKKVKAQVDIQFTTKIQAHNVVRINTFDVKSKVYKSNLDVHLEHLTFKKETANSLTFLDYRLNMLDKSTSDIERYKARIDDFFKLINQFFIKTNKKVIFDRTNNAVKFEIGETQTIELTDLSAGEKQLLILLFTIFLQDEQPCIVLMDEPEISLHIEWQGILIETLTVLNPNAQFIIVTHASSVFGKGWSDKLTWMEDIFYNPNDRNLFF